MKKFFLFSVMVLSLALIMGCGEKKGNEAEQTSKQSYSENYKKAEKCILDYEKAIKAANTCNDLETATARFYEEQARVEVPDSTEREALKPLVEKAQKAFVAKFSSLDCASEPEEGEE